MRREDIEGHIIQEQTKNFSGAKEIYLVLKNNFNTLGRYDDAGWAFKKERDMERKDYFHTGHPLRWFGSMLLNGLYGYGERPFRVIVSAGLVIVLFAFLFMSFGIRTPDRTKIKHNAAQGILVGIKELVLYARLTRLRSVPWKDFWSCLYFSTVTFTTLGYGDSRPLSKWSRLAAGIEAFTGAFMMALFVYTFARTMGGR